MTSQLSVERMATQQVAMMLLCVVRLEASGVGGLQTMHFFGLVMQVKGSSATGERAQKGSFV